MLEHIASSPLAPPEVEGMTNLRGKIVTVIDLHQCLGVPKASKPEQSAERNGMGITIERGQNLYTLMVDSIGDTVSAKKSLKDNPPSTQNEAFKRYARSVYRLEDQSLIVFDVDQLMENLESPTR